MHTFWQRRENHHRPEVSVVFPFLLLCEELVPHCLKSQHLKQQIRMTKFYKNKKNEMLVLEDKNPLHCLGLAGITSRIISTKDYRLHYELENISRWAHASRKVGRAIGSFPTS